MQPGTGDDDGDDHGVVRGDGVPLARRRLFGAAGIGVLALVVTACGDDGPLAFPAAGADDGPADDGPADDGLADDGPTGDDGPVVTVLSKDNSFDPKTVEVAVGTTVEWINGGANEHDILPAEGNPLTDFGVSLEDFPPRRVGVYRYTFTEPGTYDYFCTIHGNMRMKGMVGTVVVV